MIIQYLTAQKLISFEIGNFRWKMSIEKAIHLRDLLNDALRDSGESSNPFGSYDEGMDYMKTFNDIFKGKKK